ncbi:FAD-binding protein [Pengzhenrongella frigida]|uniref:FAD-binding protein n=1 Tax=Pengzhenrongella frigida TaxID=1259133 RepID=UPI001A92A7FB|nr:FAD-binding protein [Cellulomonas sp. HLT2-17]
MVHDVVVVGAGSAGLSCARMLQDGGADVVVVSDTIGGRLAYDAEAGVNFGAYFVMANYENARKLVTRRTRINPLSCRFHDGADGSFATVSGHSVRRSLGLGAFAVVMARFIRKYSTFKKNCEYMSQREAMELDPYIARLFVQPASEFIAAHHLTAVAQDYVSKFSYACTGVDLDSITALDFCNVAQGLLIPIHRFSFDAQAELNRLGDRFVRDTVVAHSEKDGLHTLQTAGKQQLQARNVVFATPATVTADLLGLGDIREACQLYVEHVRGRLRSGLDTEQMNLFPFTSPIVFTATQDDGTVLVYSRVPEVDRDALFVEHELLGRKDWDKAMYVTGRAYVEQQYGDSTYVAGDHNGLGLEPAAISGVYAARQILKKLVVR